ncbi:MAG: hypothetical protein H5U05_10700 [Candidatus Aminicenantes bacterium]|nr:hypothetical protein [Candidatus Aminicenantes bacterium]
MSVEITNAMVQQYKSGIEILYQQTKSKLRDAVRLEPVDGKYAFFDQIAAVEATTKTTRHADLEVANTPHKRRRVSVVDKYVADYIDQEDLYKILNNPTNAYAMNFAMALNRAIDSEIISAALGNAYTGEKGDTIVPFDSNMTVAVDVGSTGATGMNIDKLLAAKELLDANEVPDDERYIVIAPKQLIELLSTTEVSSADYNTVKALVAGDLDTFLGFKFIKSNKLSTDGNGYRECLFWHKNAMLLGVGREIGASIDPIPQKGQALLVQAWLGMGATRMQEEGVGKILCAES